MDLPRTPPTLSQVHLAEVGTCDACLSSRRQRRNVGLALGITLPGAYLGLALFAGLPHPELTPPLEALVFGLAAVMPEYAVDFVVAWRGGNTVQANGTCQQDGQDPCSLALASMTGANRLL